MQISSTDLYVFVEGKNSDPYFYANICATTPDLQVNFEICTARQLPGVSGGKQSLISFFTFLRQKNSLITSLGSRKTTCIFFLDKDIDDLKHKKKRSEHVVYTEHYDIQNYIFIHGDLLNGAAAAASVDPGRLRSDLSNATKWCFNIASLWRDWICLCLRCQEDNISCEANYGVLSKVQSRLCGPTDGTKYAAKTRVLARACGLPVAVFRQKLASTLKKVDRYFARGEHHRLFKGKWFAHVLADDIDRIMVGQPYNRNGLVDLLPPCVATTIDFTKPWTDHFKTPISNVVAKL